MEEPKAKVGYYQHKIPDPHAHLSTEERRTVVGRIDLKVFNFFFRGMLAGEHGPRQAMIDTFFQKFYEACIELKMQPVWDEGNEQKLDDLLQKMNFRDAYKEPKVRKPKAPKP